MKGVELYGQVRRAVFVEGKSQRAVAREFGIDPRTVAKMLRFPEPPGYRRTKPPKRPKLDGFTEIIDQMLEDDRSMPRKQRHTAIGVQAQRTRQITSYEWPFRVTCRQ
jgi:transposase